MQIQSIQDVRNSTEIIEVRARGSANPGEIRMQFKRTSRKMLEVDGQSYQANFLIKFADHISDAFVSMHVLSFVPIPIRSPPILLAGLH